MNSQNQGNNSSSCLQLCNQSDNVRSSSETFSLVGFALEGFVGLPASILVIVVILANPQFHHGHNLFILNSSFIEVVHQINLLLQAYAVLSHERGVLCKMAGYISFLAVGVNDGCYALIAVNRYIVICRGDVASAAYFNSRRCVAAMLALVWIGSFVLLTPESALQLWGFDEDLLACATSLRDREPWIRPAMLVLQLAVPTCTYAVTIFCNHNVLMKLRFYNANKKSLNHLRGAPKRAELNEARNIVALLLINSSLPGTLSFPTFVLKAVSFDCEEYPWPCRVTMVLFALRPTISPFILFGCLKSYRQQLLGMFDMAPRAISNVPRSSAVAPIRSPGSPVLSNIHHDMIHDVHVL